MVKFALGQFVLAHRTGRSQAAELERRFREGPLGMLPNIESWAIEEYLYHGLPEGGWRPLEAFLEHSSERFPAPAQAQLRRWTEAQFGAYEVGEVENDLVAFTEWDLVKGKPSGRPISAIALNMGGVNVYRDLRGMVTLIYLAPWAPEEGIFCGMGYGLTLPKSEIHFFAPLLGIRRPDLAGKPFPWKANGAAMRNYLASWRRRNWRQWLAERLEFPFTALVGGTPDGGMHVCEVQELIPVSEEQARQFGIYFAIPMDGEMLVAGATTVTPLDIASKNALPLWEYHAYRKRVGPPPGTVGQPPHVKLD